MSLKASSLNLIALKTALPLRTDFVNLEVKELAFTHLLQNDLCFQQFIISLFKMCIVRYNSRDVLIYTIVVVYFS